MSVQVVQSNPRLVVLTQGAIRRVIVQPRAPVQIVAAKQGPAGPRGETGGVYEHVQAAPSSVWTVNHNLGFRPNAKALSVGGVEMMAEVVHISANQLQILFDEPRSGLVVCS